MTLAPAPTKPLLIIVGPSQAGKSTLVGILTPEGEERPRVGDGGGRSITTEPKVFRTIMDYPLLDCLGYDDSQLRFTDEACGKKVFEALMSFQNVQDDVNVKCIFLVVNSLVADSDRLAPTLAWLKRSFGAAALGATVVLATKADQFDIAYSSDERQRRLRNFRKSVQDLLGGEDRLLLWWNKENHELLHSSSPIMQRQLQELQKQILERAKQLYDEQVPIDTSFTVTHERAKEVPRTKVMGDHSAAAAAAATASGGLVAGAASYFSAASTAVATATATAHAATAATSGTFYIGFGMVPTVVAPTAVAMGPVAGVALAGAGFLGLLGYAFGRCMTVKATTTTMKTWQEQEEVQQRILLDVKHFYAQAKQEISEEVRQSLANADERPSVDTSSPLVDLL